MDQDKMLKYWAAANSNCEAESTSNSRRQNQESESYENPDPDEENEDEVGNFVRTVQEAKMNLMRSLRDKLSNATGSSQIEIRTLKRRLHDSEIKNSELTQENSQLREEKRRAELSLELEKVSSSILERQLGDMTKKKAEAELKLEDKTRDFSTLQFFLDEKELEIKKLSHSILLATREKDDQNTDSSAVENLTSFSSAPAPAPAQTQTQTQKPQEQIQTNSPGFSGSFPVEPYSPTRIKIEPRAEFMETSNDEEENKKNNQQSNRRISLDSLSNSSSGPKSPQQMFSHENVEAKYEEENYRKFLCITPSTSQIPQPKMTIDKQSKSHSTSKSKSPQIKREKVKAPKTPENRFEKSISLQLKRERVFLKPSALALFESEEEGEADDDEPLKKRNRTFSGASGTSASSKTSRDEKGQKSISSSSESILNVPEIHRINYGFTNNWDMENCPHARDFWYDSNHSTVPKFLIRFYDDQEYQRDKLLHVKQQEKLEQPKIKYEKLKQVEKTLEGLSKNSSSEAGSGFRLWLDVRDFNIFSSKFSGFFKEFGKFVTHFSFGRRLFSFDEIGASQLLNFTLKYFSNLEYFAINDGMLKNMDQPLKNIREEKLEKLKTIRLMTTRFRIASPLIIKLLLHAPALETFYGVPLHCVSEIETHFKRAGNSNSNLTPWSQKQDQDGTNVISIDFVKEVIIIRNIYDDASSSFHDRQKNFLADILTLCHLNPPLEVVDARTYFIRDSAMREICVEKWSQLLNSIKNHVKSLKIEPYQMPNFPRLENLHKLQFDMDVRAFGNSSLFGYFPPEFDLKEKFPQLKVAEIGLNEKSSHFLRGDEKKSHNLFRTHFPSDVFRHCDTFNKVERLNLVNFAPPTCFLNLKALFPRITILQLTLETVEMSNALPMVYKFWPYLKQLILDVNFSSHVNYNLDSAFTGIRFSKCRTLHDQIKQKSFKLDRTKREEIIRTQRASIQDLKDLSRLKIVLNMRESDRAFEFSDCLMTPVSGIYGFGPDQMSNLKVVVGFDERMTTDDKTCVMKLLEPMKSYLTVDD